MKKCVRCEVEFKPNTWHQKFCKAECRIKNLEEATKEKNRTKIPKKRSYPHVALKPKQSIS